MTESHDGLLIKYLKANTSNEDNIRVLFYDPIDKKRVDLLLFLHPLHNQVCIGGDESEVYELEELELIDTKIINQ